MVSTPPARQRRPPDQWTYPTVQVRHRGAQAPKRGSRVGLYGCMLAWMYACELMYSWICDAN